MHVAVHDYCMYAVTWHVQVCVYVFGKREGDNRHLLLWHACGTSIILMASPLLGSATEYPTEMSSFHIDTESDQNKNCLFNLFTPLCLFLPPLTAAAWNTDKRYISGLLAGDERWWNGKSLGHSVPFSFSITNCNCLPQSLDYGNLL